MSNFHANYRDSRRRRLHFAFRMDDQMAVKASHA